MGGGSSVTVISPEDSTIVAFSSLSKEVLKEMKLSAKNCDDLTKIYRLHSNYKDGTVHLKEFTQILNIEQNILSIGLFERFALGSNQKLQLVEFICSVWSFLSPHDHAMGTYIFFLFDEENKGRLSVEDMRCMFDMIEDCHMQICNKKEKRLMKRDIKNIFRSAEIKRRGYLTMQKMDEWSKAHQNLFEYFRIAQRSGRMYVISADFWKEQQRIRSKDPDLTFPNYIYDCLMNGVKVARSKRHSTSQRKRNNSGNEKAATFTNLATSEHHTMDSNRNPSHIPATADYAGHLTKWIRVRCKKNKIYEVNSRLTVRKTRKNTVETALQSSHLIDKFIENFKID